MDLDFFIPAFNVFYTILKKMTSGTGFLYFKVVYAIS